MRSETEEQENARAYTSEREAKQSMYARSSLFKDPVVGESMACLKNQNILKRMEWQSQSVERHKAMR